MGLLHTYLLSGIILNMINEPNYLNDIHADDLFIEADERDSIPMTGADEHDVPVWIENEDGSGQWSDGWDGDMPECDDDPYYRECMSATSGDDISKADYMDMYNMENDR